MLLFDSMLVHFGLACCHAQFKKSPGYNFALTITMEPCKIMENTCRGAVVLTYLSLAGF
jgi:hypothetical protein